MTARQLAELMVGSELPSPETRESTVTDRADARASTGVDRSPTATAAPLLDDITFTIHKGEVLGIAGVEGNGQAELVEAIMGMRAPTRGRVTLDGEDISALADPRSAARRASATSPRTGTGTACCSRRRCGRTASSATRPSAPTSRARGSTGPARAQGHRADRRRTTTSARRASTSSPPRCPAATSRSSSSGREMSGDPKCC